MFTRTSTSASEALIRRFALSGALALLFAVTGCGRPGETSSFATRAEAGDAVPVWVPVTALDVKQKVERGSGAFWLRFRLPPAGRLALETELLRVPDAQVATLTFRPPRGVDWWFRGLVQVVPARETTVVAADVFSGAGRTVPRRTTVAFDRASDAVYAWDPGR